MHSEKRPYYYISNSNTICQYCKAKININSQNEHILNDHFSELNSQMKAKTTAELCVPKIRSIIDNAYEVQCLSRIVYDNADISMLDEEWFQEFQRLMKRIVILFGQYKNKN